MIETFCLVMSGAFGAVVKDLVQDNKLVLPKIQDGCLVLGFIGGMIIGAGVGYAVDNDPVTAFLGGYAGSQLIEQLIIREKDK